MVALAEGGLEKLQQRANQADRQKAGEKWHLFPKDVWGL